VTEGVERDNCGTVNPEGINWIGEV